MSPLRIGNIKVLIKVVSVYLGNKLLMQSKKIVFQLKLKKSHVALFLLPLSELFPCSQKICYTDNIMEKASSNVTPPLSLSLSLSLSSE